MTRKREAWLCTCPDCRHRICSSTRDEAALECWGHLLLEHDRWPDIDELRALTERLLDEDELAEYRQLPLTPETG